MTGRCLWAFSHISDHPEHPYGDVTQGEPLDLRPPPQALTEPAPAHPQPRPRSRGPDRLTPALDQRLQRRSLWFRQLFYEQSKTTPAGEHASSA